MRNVRLGIISTLVAASILLFTGCGGNIVLKQYKEVAKDAPIASIKTSMGDIKVVLFPEEAPETVKNFISLAKEGAYDEVLIYCTINNFGFQAGDTVSIDKAGNKDNSDEPLNGEFSDNLWNFRGALSLVNDESSTSSEFLIVQAPTVSEQMLEEMKAAGFPLQVIEKYKENGGAPWLDKTYPVFGHVIEGMDVVDAIAQVKADQNNKPLEDITIVSIVVNE